MFLFISGIYHQAHGEQNSHTHKDTHTKTDLGIHHTDIRSHALRQTPRDTIRYTRSVTQASHQHTEGHTRGHGHTYPLTHSLRETQILWGRQSGTHNIRHPETTKGIEITLVCRQTWRDQQDTLETKHKALQPNEPRPLPQWRPSLHPSNCSKPHHLREGTEALLLGACPSLEEALGVGRGRHLVDQTSQYRATQS